MAQKIKNQKNKKNTAKAKPVKAAGKHPAKKTKAGSPKPKIVKKGQKAVPPVKKKTALPASGKPGKAPVKAVKSVPKVIKTPLSPAKNQVNLKNHAVKQNAVSKTTAVSSKKNKKEPVLALSQPAVPVQNLPTIKKPGAGQVQQRRNPGKQQKKVYRTELIFPNQLKETPLLKPKNKPEPKGKFVLEFLVKSSPTLLFDFLSTPSGLSEWFADDVDIRNEEFTFHWDGQVQRARLLAYKQDHLLRLRWADKNEEFYFEFRIDVDDLTGDVTLIVSDFGESEDDVRTSRLLWESQIGKLLKVIGAY